MHKEAELKLEGIFGIKAKIQNDTVKVTVPKINGNHIANLSDLYFMDGVKDVKLKRSGTNITVLVEIV